MKLLIITQKVDQDDDVLGFFHDWLIEFSKTVDQLTVVCLEKGIHDLPHNIEVLSLGKENKKSKIIYLKNFYKYIWSKRENYDSVFVHMNFLYVLLGGLIWKVLGKKIGLWYVHRQVSFGLRIATKISDFIFSSAPESFRVKSKKTVYLGHGIDTKKFECLAQNGGGPITMIHVGRISKIKKCDLLIKILPTLTKRHQNILLKFIGAPVTSEDKKYFEQLKELAKQLNVTDKVLFVGSVANKNIAEEYCRSSFSVNLAPSGGMDKAVLESLASNRVVFVTNNVFKTILGNAWEQFSFKDEDDLSQKILQFLEKPQTDVVKMLSDRVKREYDIGVIVPKIVKQYN